MPERPPRATWDGQWRPDPASVAAFRALTPGTALTIVKRDLEGRHVTSYPAMVVETGAPAPWVEVVATWTHGHVEVGGLTFEPGDTLHEFFSAEHPCNAFAVLAPEEELRGWYGNVTYPAFMDRIEGVDVLVWHDLYLDVVILPGEVPHLLDDDELEASGLPDRDPAFAGAIVSARRDLIAIIPILMAGDVKRP